jgi:hypothetical protein
LVLTGSVAVVALAVVGRQWDLSVREASRGLDAPSEAAPSGGSALVPKGDASMTLIRERGAAQEYFRGKVATVSPGDHLRLGFYMKEAGPVGAGILTDDGRWVPFFEGVLAAGKHTPGTTLAVDDEPSSGRVLVGRPDALEAVRRGERGAGVEVMRLVWQGERR